MKEVVNQNQESLQANKDPLQVSREAAIASVQPQPGDTQVSQKTPDLGTTLVLPDGDPNKDDTVEKEGSKGQLERVFKLIEKAMESGVKLDSLQKDVFLDAAQRKDIQEDIGAHFEDVYAQLAEDPYAKYILLQFVSLPDEEMKILEHAAKNEPLSEESLDSLVTILNEKINMHPFDAKSIFYMSFLNVAFASMDLKHKQGILPALRSDNKNALIGKMQMIGLIDENDVNAYTRGMSSENAELVRTSVARERQFIEAELKDSPDVKVIYQTSLHKAEKSEMDKQYLLTNVPLKAGGFLISFMTFCLNAGGAVRLLLKGRIGEAFEHVAKHPWLPMSAAAMYGTMQALKNPNIKVTDLVRQAMEPEAEVLMGMGVDHAALEIFANGAYEKIDAILKNKNEGDLTAADRARLEKVVQTFVGKKRFSVRERSDTVDDVIRMYSFMNSHNYDSPDEAQNFGKKMIKKYTKIEKAIRAEVLDKSEEVQEEQKQEGALEQVSDSKDGGAQLIQES